MERPTARRACVLQPINSQQQHHAKQASKQASKKEQRKDNKTHKRQVKSINAALKWLAISNSILLWFAIWLNGNLVA
jgi:hypothetical protein